MVSVSVMAMILVHQHLNYYPGSKESNEGTLQIFLGVCRKIPSCLFKNCKSDKEKGWSRIELGIGGRNRQERFSKRNLSALPDAKGRHSRGK